MGIFNNNKDDEGGPVMARPGSSFKKTTSPFGKSPAFSKAAGSIRDRLKNLSKKDLAFVAMGLSILVAAPIAEHMISAPPSPGELSAGFGDRRKGALDGSLYEPGINSLSQGSPDGSGEVITPLSSRDPASLIIGSPSSQPPAPPSAPPSDVRDAPREIARNAAATAMRSAGVPTVIPKMQTALRGMSAFGGEGTRTTGSLGGGQILASAKSASGKSATRSMVSPVGVPGYGGVASSQNSANKGSYENLRGQADRAASNFGGGSSYSSLEKAAGESMHVPGGPGGMTGSDGEKFSRPAGSSVKDHRQMGGESLAQMAARMRMQKALEWEFFLKYDIPKQIINALVSGVAGSLQEMAKKATNSLTGQGPGPEAKKMYCGNAGPGGDCSKPVIIPVSACGNGKDKPGIKCICDCYFGDSPTGTGGGSGGGSGGSGGSGGGGLSPSPGQSQSPEAKPPSNNQVFGDYDETLKQMYINVTDGGRTEDDRKKLECALQVAGAFDNLRADSVAREVVAGADKTRQDAIVPFDEAIARTEQNTAAVQGDVQGFASQAAGVEQSARNGTINSDPRLVGGVSMQAQTTQEVAPFIGDNLNTLSANAGVNFQSAAEVVAYFKQASALYKSQLDHVKERANKVAEEYTGIVLPGARAITEELTPLINKHILSEEDKAIIKGKFEQLAGQEYFKKALAWRGANPEAYSGGQVDCTDTEAKEKAAWESINPAVKYNNGHEAISDQDNLAQGNLYAALFRGYPEREGYAGEIYSSAKYLVNQEVNTPMNEAIAAFHGTAVHKAAMQERMGGTGYGLDIKQ